MHISVFGLGYVGSVSAACFANEGHHVIGVDVNSEKVNLINAGKATIVEKDLGDITAKAVKDQRLRATHSVEEAINSTDLSFICVGTPSKKNNSIDLQYVTRVCEEIGSVLKNKSGHHTIAVRSTMFPGSMRNIVIPTLEKFSGKKQGSDFTICINPEFMMEGTSVYDFYHPPKNVIGTIGAVGCNVLVDLNQSITKMPTHSMELEAAELVKYCDNVWHALKVGYANEIGNLCKEIGIDSHAVMDVFCKDTKLNLSPYYLKPGFAFGGSCLPKDLRAFVYESEKINLRLPIISSVLPSNKLQIENALHLIMEQGNKKIGFLGFSFKENTDDLRESPMVELIERLLGKGYELTLYDANVTEAKLNGSNRDYLLNHIPHVTQLMVTSLDEVLARSQTIVIGNKASEFASVLEKMNDNHVIIDLVRIQKVPPLSKQYIGIGW